MRTFLFIIVGKKIAAESNGYVRVDMTGAKRREVVHNGEDHLNYLRSLMDLN